MTTKKQKKGVALLWALILSSILLIISGTMVGYIIKESKFSIRIEESTRAYAAARSGVEWGINYMDQRPIGQLPTTAKIMTLEGAKITVTFAKAGSPGCPTSPIIYCVYSNAMVKKVNRRLEHQQKRATITVVTPPLNTDPNDYLLPDNKESFELGFSFWTTHNNSQFSFGLTDVSGNNKIFFDYGMDMRGPMLGFVHDGASPVYSSIGYNIKDYFPNNKNEYAYKATIRYIKDTTVQLKLKRKIIIGPDEGGYECVGAVNLDLVGKNFGNLNSLFVSAPYNPTVTYGSVPGESGAPYIVVRDSYISIIDNIFFTN